MKASSPSLVSADGSPPSRFHVGEAIPRGDAPVSLRPAWRTTDGGAVAGGAAVAATAAAVAVLLAMSVFINCSSLSSILVLL